MSETSATPARVSAKKHETVKHEMHQMRIDKADNGGYSVTHEFRQKGKSPYDGAHKPSETHVFADFKSMHKHIPAAFGEGDANPKGKAETPKAGAGPSGRKPAAANTKENVEE